MRRGLYMLLAWVAVILGALLTAAGVLFLVLNLLTALFPGLPYTTYPQAFIMGLLGAMVVIAWRIIFGRVP